MVHPVCLFTQRLFRDGQHPVCRRAQYSVLYQHRRPPLPLLLGGPLAMGDPVQSEDVPVLGRHFVRLHGIAILSDKRGLQERQILPQGVINLDLAGHGNRYGFL